jgi:DNA-binding response OmpR family regulator
MGTNPKRILLVEDDQRVALAISIRLRMAGFHVITAFDGVNAIDAVRSARPDLVVLDLGLPGIGGLEAAERIRSVPETAALPIIVVTAMRDPDLRARALERGVFAYFEKPFESAELLRTIHEALGVEVR